MCNGLVFRESQSSAFWFQPVWGPCVWAQPKVTIRHLGGSPSSRGGTQIRLLCTSSEDVHSSQDQDPAPRLHCCFLTALPLFPHSLIPLISNCLNLLFGAQGRSRGLKAFFLQTRNGGHGKAFVPGRAPQGPAQFQYHNIRLEYEIRTCSSIGSISEKKIQ